MSVYVKLPRNLPMVYLCSRTAVVDVDHSNLYALSSSLRPYLLVVFVSTVDFAGKKAAASVCASCTLDKFSPLCACDMIIAMPVDPDFLCDVHRVGANKRVTLLHLHGFVVIAPHNMVQWASRSAGG
ncbi:unnamed protein product [Ectocarpus fasciculatus]